MGPDLTKLTKTKLFPGNPSNLKDLRIKRYNPVHYPIQKQSDEFKDRDQLQEREWYRQNVENIPQQNDLINYEKNDYGSFDDQRMNDFCNYAPLQPLNTYYQSINNNMFNDELIDDSQDNPHYNNTINYHVSRKHNPANIEDQWDFPEKNSYSMLNNRGSYMPKESHKLNRNMSQPRLVQYREAFSPFQEDKSYCSEKYQYNNSPKQYLQSAKARKLTFIEDYDRMNEFQNESYSRQTITKNHQLNDYQPRRVLKEISEKFYA